MAIRRRRMLELAATQALAQALLPTSAIGARPRNKTMSTRQIPRTKEAIPMVGMGTWQTFDMGRRGSVRDQLVEVLRAFLDAGGRVIDSSPMYGRSEAVVGELLAQIDKKNTAFLATKVWTTGREQGIAQMQASLTKMGTKRMDLMQIHNLVDWRTQLATLREWKAQGRVRYIGATHYRLDAFDELERILKTEKLDFVQLPYSLGVRDAERRLLPCAADTGTAVLVMRPFEAGSLFRQVRGRALPAWAADADCESWAQVFLKFILGHPAVTCPIPATSKPKHMRDNVRAGFGRMPDPATRKKMIAVLEG